MKDKVHFSSSGLAFFERTMRTCPPRLSNGGREIKERLYNRAISCAEISFIELMDQLGQNDWRETVFGHFFEDLDRRNISTINEMAVATYFGGTPHIANIGQKLESGGIDIPKSLGSLYPTYVKFIHTLLPVTVESVAGMGYTAKYRNAGYEITLFNLLPLGDMEREIIKSQKVWTHLGSIVSAVVDPEIEQVVSAIQGTDSYFMRVCELVEADGVDVSKLHYYAWARVASGLFCS